MKQFNLTILLTMLVSMVSTKALAYDVSVANEDGKTIYYNYINNSTELEVAKSNYSGDIKIPETVTILNKTRKVTSIGSEAFRYCSGLTSVTIPASVTSIGSYAFSNCSGLKKVIVKDLAAWCGISCRGNYSNPLYYAEHLYSDEDTEITDLIIPDGVTSIGSSAFSNCDNLADFVSLIQEPFKVSSIVSDFIYKNGTLYVPEGTMEKYKATDGWKEFLWMEEGMPAGIKLTNSDGSNVMEIQRYTIGGESIDHPQRGVNIVKMSDGTVKKVLVK